ncbi:uncharacterized protein LOC120428118 [Culex pipiens pallens]|uniref:uncharacterized protein LOC120428118 n=1 Tax=Culex pipiens pallens TaxID=42434 RepID=UPI0019535106|nr:uncharacterized protein LOC120428118 [Culex pipiens pallens]
MIAEDTLLRFSGVPLGEACTDEADRLLHDALCVLAAETSADEDDDDRRQRKSTVCNAYLSEECTCNQHAHRRTLQRWPDLDILDSRIMLLEQKFNEKMIVSMKMNKTTSQMSFKYS